MVWLKLKLKNFQKHEALDIEFGPRVTTIVGRSDIGKTAIVRALRWIGYNRPAGTAIIKNGTDTAYALLTLTNHKVLRVRGKKGNYYALDGKKAVAFKSDVPDKIADVLRLGAENLQRQTDPPFWLELTPRDLAKKLNEIIGMDNAEELKSRLATKLRRVGAEERVLVDQIQKIKRQINQYSLLEPLMSAYRRCQQIATILEETTRSRANVEKLIQTLEESDKAQETLESVGSALEKFIKTSSVTVKAHNLSEQLRQLIKGVNPIPSFTVELKARFDAWLAARGISTQAYERRVNLETLISEIEVETEECQRLKKELKSLESLPLSGTCPTCGRSLQKTKILDESPF